MIQEARAVPDAPRASAPPSSHSHRRAADQGQCPTTPEPFVTAQRRGNKTLDRDTAQGEIVSGLAVILFVSFDSATVLSPSATAMM